ncbi:hypothetical protein GLOTRDRAFT_107162 [Gloeophyllum trabeum ATCC 11539]|uniref:Uncharacterized protein n=1 Tax=Gloeophyllum trabeum (strain ATCC 11539 / FP-39264 / Madison 617) TaxID=670483 RepID=S7RFU8_GLOTA|nr:uncharacterized protein GLOTRDRAFT_107162 [Gloeophyllum trabeum ATCC 11539]EPQ53060.1 hypothetical protein GLOTRDRAFT_107162 [Gloeophyllum trabeum ATCC 11539]
MDYDAYDALLHHVFKQTQGDAWFKPSEENAYGGVCLRVQPGHFRVFPYENRFLEPFEAAVRVLNPVIAVKLRSAAVHAALSTVDENANGIQVDANTRIQILETMAYLPGADKEQCGAFIRDERVLVLWSDSLDSIVPLCQEFEQQLIKLVWRNRPILKPASTMASMVSAAESGSDVNLTEKAEDQPQVSVREVKPVKTSKRLWGWRVSSKPHQTEEQTDVEKGTREPRPIRLFAPIYNGLGIALSIFFIGSGVSMLLSEWVQDGSYTRFALLVTVPFVFCVSLFFALQIIGNLAMALGPVAQYHENSKYYSAVKPKPNREIDSNLPHVTIEMPVYKESLKETIAPSVYSLKKAMQTYARQGGTSSILVHDDGLQLISPEEREARISFYSDHNIGWVARPPHDNKPDGFKRAGRFKKASNMNYGLDLSLRLEKHLKVLVEAEQEELRQGGISVNSSASDMQCLEDRAMNMALEEMWDEWGRRPGFRGWACNGKSLRVGDIILIIDSDTIVPEDCLRDAARELAECPEIGIIQHESDVMQVAHHYFENGIAHFTRRINKCISIGTANGEVAPFVGHNAFLRWSALQDAAFIDTADGKRKIWSEANVSEDFDMALRLMLKGYVIRWATYSEGGFKEGVSLTCDDELNRWQKYSYGCSELMFNPIVEWYKKGPINKQLHGFIWSSAPVHYKISMMSYGIAAGFTLSIMNYLLLGFAVDIDGFYMHSFEIWLACTVVFPGLGNFAYTLLEYRLGLRSIWSATKENLTWVPFFFFFFGGLSIHLTQSILAHLFSYNITWGATKKEVERSNFFIEVPKILRRFWLALILSFLSIAMMVVLATPAIPTGWQITGEGWAVIFPLAIVSGCHILYPVVLNPWLMIFSY